MHITLHKARLADAEQIHECQIAAFQPLLEKYQDMDSNPANEPLSRTIDRINRPDGGFYKIMTEGQFMGAICLYSKEPDVYWISPIFIHPDHQGNGIAQQVLKLTEDMHSDVRIWRVATLREETGNCLLYEKMGYQRTGKIQKLNDRATLIYYEKRI
ncbi:GNAT family N-acetyltransferase [Terribacillus saccharophilus]|uniref:GNAT family N-acetyltransferase n=1 Tax=Terribacillus saccharophilus TaxID=361277 RepID=UPI003982A907